MKLSLAALGRGNTRGGQLSRVMDVNVWVWVYLSAVLSGCVVIIFRERLLPPRFSYDSIRIQSEAAGDYTGLTDRSFAAIASLYRVLGLAERPGLVAWLSLACVALVVGCAIPMASKAALTLNQVFLAFLAVNLGAVYLGTYSKDLVVLAIGILCLRLKSRLSLEFVFVGAMVAYGVVFREYWLVIAALYVGFRLTWRWMRNEWWLLGLVAAAVVAVSIALYLALDVPPDHFRNVVNESRSGGADMSTAINRVVEGDGLLAGIANVLAAGLFLVLPIPLLAIGTAYHVAVGLLLMLMWGGFFRTVLRTMRNGDLKSDSLQARGICLILAVVVIQSLFEPDYGSALKHLTPLLAIFLAVAIRADAGHARRSLSIAARREVR